VQFYEHLNVVELSFEQQHLKYYQTSGNCFQADKTERKKHADTIANLSNLENLLMPRGTKQNRSRIGSVQCFFSTRFTADISLV
jgi:hypothetical protein